MKLIIEKEGRGRCRASIATKLGIIDLREWLEIKVNPYKVTGKKHTAGLNYTDLLAVAETDHSNYYQYIKSDIGFTPTILRIIQALGYEIHIVKKDQEHTNAR